MGKSRGDVPAGADRLSYPSPVQHYVHPNLSEEHCVTVSFNLIMDRHTGSK